MISWDEIIIYTKSNHNYNLEKFGLSEEQIRKDCEKIYGTFFAN